MRRCQEMSIISEDEGVRHFCYRIAFKIVTLILRRNPFRSGRCDNIDRFSVPGKGGMLESFRFHEVDPFLSFRS
jgi:hypothetical protein